MASPSSVRGLTPIGLTVGAQKPDPDRVLRIAQAHAYPRQVLWLLASFTALVALCHLASLLLKMLQTKRSEKDEGARGSISLRRIPIALLEIFRVLAYRYTIPIGRSYTLNLAEVFLTAAYITIIFTWSMINSTNTLGTKYDPKYWANVAGTVAASQLPIVTVLGTRNNVLSWITGVSFDKMAYLHRMSARAVCILTWVHGAGRIKLGVTGAVSWVHPTTQAGLLASIAWTLLCIISIRPLREAGYEFFLIIHFLFAFIILLGAYFHSQEFEFGYFIWPSFVIWGFDRVARLIRIVLFNLGTSESKTNTHELNAAVEVLSPHFLRLTMCRPRYFHWLPGQSAFLTVPSVSTLPFESHPFTISTIDMPTRAESGSITPPTPADTEEKRSGSSTPASGGPAHGGELLFLIRVRSGFTRRLLKSASEQHPVRVLVEGPYSSPPCLRGYDTAVLVAGGSGVAFTLPLLLDLIHRARSIPGFECRRVVFIWAIRDIEHIRWIDDTLSPALKDVPPTLSVSVQFYVTTSMDEVEAQVWDDDSMHSDAEQETGTTNAARSSRLVRSPLVRVEQGRPDLKALLDEETRKATGAMSVNVCGTHALASAVRHSLRTFRPLDVLRGGPSVTLHVEAFGSA